MKTINNFYEKEISKKKTLFILWVGYFAIVALLASQLNKIFCPIWGDVLLYNEEAKSLATSGTIKFANIFVRNGAYIYPALLSLIYKFAYNPYTITFITRIIGIAIMTSTLFPSYLLLKKMDFSNKKALVLSFVSVLIPDMMQSWFTVTEVLAYPLFIWTIYIFYIDVIKEKSCITAISLSIICYLDYLTRGQNLVIAIAYIFTMASFAFLDVKKKTYELVNNKIKKILLFSIPYLIMYVGIPKIMTVGKVIADTKDKSAIYVIETLNNVLTNPSYFLAEWGIGIFWYLFYIILGFGFFTVVIPFFYNEYEPREKKMVIFLNITLVLTLIVVVLTIFTQEEPLGGETHRVHLRYFMYFYSPYMFLLYKINFDKFKWRRIYSLISMFFVSFIVLGRYVYSIKENYFLGAEGMALTIYKVLKEKLTEYPALECWVTVGTIVVIGLLVYLLHQQGWKRFIQFSFPMFIAIVTIANISLYTSRNIYLTEIGQGDYIGRYAPVAEFLNQYNQDEVVLVVKELADDNEIQTLQLILEKSVDVISLPEIDNMSNVQGKDLSISSFDRTGYLYNSQSKHRILKNAKCIAFFKQHLCGKYVVFNDAIYEDNNFVVYCLDQGILHIEKTKSNN